MILIPITVVGGAVFYHSFVCKRGAKRNARSLCARCARHIDVANAYNLSDLVVCDRCALTTERNNKAAQRLAAGMIIVLVILMVIGFGIDFASGVRFDGTSIRVILMIVMTAAGFVGLLRKHLIKPMRSKKPSKSMANKPSEATR